MKTTCDRLPDDVHRLSSQPALSRFENCVEWPTLRRLMRWLEASYVESLPSDTTQVILDIDSTDGETHDVQQMSFFGGYYDHYMYHPDLVFKGENGQLITSRLRPGNTHASRQSAGLLARLIRRIKKRFPDAHILVRGDSGFCVPKILHVIDGLDRDFGDVDYLLGIIRDKVFERFASPAMDTAEEMYRLSGRKVRHFTEFEYSAGSWDRQRLVVAKAEHTSLGRNPRFVVTSLRGFPPELIYNACCQRGQCENNIKDLKNALQADRLSCLSFIANFFRLLRHSGAYRLMHEFRNRVGEHSQKLGRAQFDTMSLRILKVGASVKQSVRRIHIRLPQAFPFAAVFRAIAAGLDPPPLPA